MTLRLIYLADLASSPAALTGQGLVPQDCRGRGMHVAFAWCQMAIADPRPTDPQTHREQTQHIHAKLVEQPKRCSYSNV